MGIFYTLDLLNQKQFRKYHGISERKFCKMWLACRLEIFHFYNDNEIFGKFSVPGNFSWVEMSLQPSGYPGTSGRNGTCGPAILLERSDQLRDSCRALTTSSCINGNTKRILQQACRNACKDLHLSLCLRAPDMFNSKHKLCKYGGLANIAVLFAFQI